MKPLKSVILIHIILSFYKLLGSQLTAFPAWNNTVQDKI